MKWSRLCGQSCSVSNAVLCRPINHPRCPVLQKANRFSTTRGTRTRTISTRSPQPAFVCVDEGMKIAHAIVLNAKLVEMPDKRVQIVEI